MTREQQIDEAVRAAAPWIGDMIRWREMSFPSLRGAVTGSAAGWGHPRGNLVRTIRAEFRRIASVADA